MPDQPTVDPISASTPEETPPKEISEKKSFRLAVPLLIIAILIILVVGIGLFTRIINPQSTFTAKKRTDSLDSNDETTKPLNFIGHWLNEHDREKLVKETVAEFELTTPGIAVNLKWPQNIRGYRSKRDVATMYVEMIESGNYEWDVIWLDDQIYQYTADALGDSDWGPKYLVNFGEIEGFKETQKDFIFDNPIWAAQTGDIIVGPMIEGYYHALFFNKDVADKAGIEIKQYGMTWDDFVGYLKQLDDYNKKNGTNIAGLYESNDWTNSEILFQRLVRSAIGDFEESLKLEGSPKKNAAFMEALIAFEEAGKYKPLIKGWENNVWFQTRQLVLNDKALFYPNGIWMYNHWMSVNEEKATKMIPAELPTLHEVDFYQGGYIPTWAVWKDAPNKEAAIEFLKFWSKPQTAEKWTRYTMAPTGLKGSVTEGTQQHHPFALWQREIEKTYGGDVYYLPSSTYIFGKENALLQDDIKTVMLNVLEGEMTAQEAYNTVTAKLQ